MATPAIPPQKTVEEALSTSSKISIATKVAPKWGSVLTPAQHIFMQHIAYFENCVAVLQGCTNRIRHNTLDSRIKKIKGVTEERLGRILPISNRLLPDQVNDIASLIFRGPHFLDHPTIDEMNDVKERDSLTIHVRTVAENLFGPEDTSLTEESVLNMALAKIQAQNPQKSINEV